MSENVQEKKSSSKTIIILLIVLIVLVIGGIVTAALILLNRNDDDISAEAEETRVTIGYEGNGVVPIDEDELLKIFNEMVEQAREGTIDLQYKNVAASEDGVNFQCMLGNPITNKYDMYLNIYLNHDLEQQVLLTGLLPPGTQLDNFVSEIPLEPGGYDATLVFTQVEDDHGTIHGQSMVVLQLLVAQEYEFDDSIFD